MLELVGDDASGVGYLLKDRVRDVGEFVDAVERVAAGGTAFDPEVVKSLVGGHRRSSLDELTDRERDVLSLIAEGRSNRAIGKAAVPQPARGRAPRAGDLPEARAPGHRGRQPPRPRRPGAARALGAVRGPGAVKELVALSHKLDSEAGRATQAARRAADARARTSPGLCGSVPLAESRDSSAEGLSEIRRGSCG